MYVNQGPSSHPRTPTVVLINEVSNGGGFVTSSEISNTPTDSVFPLASSGFLLTGVYTTCITLTFGIPTPEPFTAAHVVTIDAASRSTPVQSISSFAFPAGNVAVAVTHLLPRHSDSITNGE
ncbi:hypothetical protein B0H17DRAFT_575435 [Mycena rosella]|uniref:Uncharacterized protein n=1 Tax=Mycena rosella TaxID=1033263 RepID=A0AAD7DH14_MYCRO|nr:hypothetical protein B0H17DRAFT_575435 [Mycena rosella]